MKKKVYIGFSGGVDSSVATYLLKEQGYNVTGIFMTNIAEDTYPGQCQLEELKNAKKVAEYLNIPLEVVNLQKNFDGKVKERFMREYLSGNTPNPCIECNKLIKFGDLAEECFNRGADLIATGHYAKTRKGKLLKAKDKSKDQTYFLNKVSSEILTKTLFPLENLTKDKVRKIAKEIGLPNFKKKDSQKICFLKGIKIEELFENKPGNIVDIDTEEIVGQHEGAYKYTIGQRGGIEIGGLDKPYFVAKKDIEKNILYVAKGRDNPALWKDEFIVEDFHFIHPDNILKMRRLKAVIRYHSEEITTSVSWVKENHIYKGEFKLKKKQWAPSTGQSLVIYRGKECIGGGEISTIL